MFLGERGERGTAIMSPMRSAKAALRAFMHTCLLYFLTLLYKIGFGCDQNASKRLTNPLTCSQMHPNSSKCIHMLSYALKCFAMPARYLKPAPCLQMFPNAPETLHDASKCCQMFANTPECPPILKSYQMLPNNPKSKCKYTKKTSTAAKTNTQTHKLTNAQTRK
jgi:hypothetical protein